MNVQINEEQNGRATVIVTTKAGNRYYCDWAHVPTIEEVKEQWKLSRKWFVHIN